MVGFISASEDQVNSLIREQLSFALRELGLSLGSNVMVHSSLSSMGHLDGGADTAVESLLDVIGPSGTLVVPTFTPCHFPDKEVNPVFDPLKDHSQMGQITEAVRKWPGAKRSRHLLHSLAAIGPLARDITDVHGPSAWACDGPFWKLYELDAYILLLGVPYLRCTYFHVVE